MKENGEQDGSVPQAPKVARLRRAQRHWEKKMEKPEYLAADVFSKSVSRAVVRALGKPMTLREWHDLHERLFLKVDWRTLSGMRQAWYARGIIVSPHPKVPLRTYKYVSLRWTREVINKLGWCGDAATKRELMRRSADYNARAEPVRTGNPIHRWRKRLDRYDAAVDELLERISFEGVAVEWQEVEPYEGRRLAQPQFRAID